MKYTINITQKKCTFAVTQPSLLKGTNPKPFFAGICKKLKKDFLKTFKLGNLLKPLALTAFLYLSSKKSEICIFCAI